jgi:hypothetical protein
MYRRVRVTDGLGRIAWRPDSAPTFWGNVRNRLRKGPDMPIRITDRILSLAKFLCGQWLTIDAPERSAKS